MTQKKSQISAAEWEIMTILWSVPPPLTSKDVLDKLPSRRWKQKTVNTFLARLKDKGVVAAQKVRNVYHYTPLVQAEDCVQEKTRFFMDQFFKGAVAPMVLQLVKQTDLTPQEIDELEDILKQKRRSDQ
jgi:BlaI family penicillinase repressor